MDSGLDADVYIHGNPLSEIPLDLAPTAIVGKSGSQYI